jgi:predicted O-methyltransferase YrrM
MMTNDYDRSIARRIHQQFSEKSGSGRIASEFSLLHLSRLIRLRKPRSVLEIGSGIGTVSQLVLAHAERVEHLFSVEEDEFCRDAIKKNLTVHDLQKWTLLNSQKELPPDLTFDLIIFDGNQYEDTIFDLLRSTTAVFVDGKRQETRAELAAYCQQAGLRLRLHQYTGGWRMVLRGTNGSRSYPKLIFKRDQCHWGVCQPKDAVPDLELGPQAAHVQTA